MPMQSSSLTATALFAQAAPRIMVANADDKAKFALSHPSRRAALPSTWRGRIRYAADEMADIFILTILTSRYIFPANSRLRNAIAAATVARALAYKQHDQNSARQAHAHPRRAERIDGPKITRRCRLRAYAGSLTALL